MAFKRKLTALGYPSPDKFDPGNENQFRDMVVWLEDQKIRHYSIDDRASLRDTRAGNWTETYSTNCYSRFVHHKYDCEHKFDQPRGFWNVWKRKWGRAAAVRHRVDSRDTHIPCSWSHHPHYCDRCVLQK